jgi:hypothetical protein
MRQHDELQAQSTGGDLGLMVTSHRQDVTSHRQDEAHDTQGNS